jgi:methylated-DNA-protein-cysteine methyltransferase-like protein
MKYFDAVRLAVCRIPAGRVATYGDVAAAAGFPGSARQVAWALRNADAWGIPWHRVVGRGGRILLQGNAGLLQRRLLQQENVLFCGALVNLTSHRFVFPSRKRR